MTVTKGEHTRAAILDQAVAIASEVGFTGLSIGQLAQQTEMSKSGLFAHFRSKEALQLETLEWARERFTDVVVRPTLAAPRGQRRVRALFDHWLDWETSALRGGCIFVAASAEFDDQPGAMRDAVVRNQRDWLDFVVTVVRTAVAEGDFGEDVDAEQVAFTLQSLMLGYHHAARLMRDPHALDRTRRALDQVLDSSAAPDRAGATRT